MTKIVLIGTFSINIALFILLCVSFFLLHNEYVFKRLIVAICAFIYLCIAAFFLYKDQQKITAWMLVCVYGIIGFLTLHTWGLNAPIGILSLSFVIVLASVMLGAKYILGVTAAIIISLIAIQHLTVIGLSTPDTSNLDNTSTYGDVISYGVILSIYTLIAWLSGRRSEKALLRAVKAEAELESERNALKTRVEEQGKSLDAAKEAELKQLYNFAELGQLTTVILHELANYLSILTLDIDDMRDRHEGSVEMQRAKENIFYIDTLIDQVRQQITSTDQAQKFDTREATLEAITQARKKLHNARIYFYYKGKPKSKYMSFGDPLRLFQVITILITNAAQASNKNKSEIFVTLSATSKRIHISVKDNGRGITKENRLTLFEPKRKAGGAGLGIGLYVTKQIIDTHFRGKIWLSPETNFTQFNIEIPRLD